MKNPKPKIVGIIGKLNSGKNVLANSFVQVGYTQRAFADPLKEVVRDLFDIPEEILWGPSENRTGEVRQMLQELGTDYARKFRPNIWVDKMGTFVANFMSEHLHYQGIIIPDVRFVKEAQMLHNLGATLIRITRDHSGAHEIAATTAHLSETANTDIPIEWIAHNIDNNRTLGDLNHRGMDLARSLLR